MKGAMATKQVANVPPPHAGEEEGEWDCNDWDGDEFFDESVYRPLPTGDPTPDSKVVLKAAASSGAQRMREALESIGYEMVEWSPLVATIKKKDETTPTPPLPYIFEGKFRGFILDYEENF
jgi:hypothetical protein